MHVINRDQARSGAQGRTRVDAGPTGDVCRGRRRAAVLTRADSVNDLGARVGAAVRSNCSRRAARSCGWRASGAGAGAQGDVRAARVRAVRRGAAHLGRRLELDGLYLGASERRSTAAISALCLDGGERGRGASRGLAQSIAARWTAAAARSAHWPCPRRNRPLATAALLTMVAGSLQGAGARGDSALRFRAFSAICAQ